MAFFTCGVTLNTNMRPIGSIDWFKTGNTGPVKVNNLIVLI